MLHFIEPFTDIDLYWIGYLQADGSITRNSSSIRFAQKYYEPVYEFAQYFKGVTHVHQSIAGTKHICPGYVSYHASAPFNKQGSLNNIGLKKELRADIYKSKHFWRGMVDGDGCISLSGSVPVIGLCGNHNDMSMFANYVESLGLCKPKIGIARSIFQVRISGEAAAYLSKELYLGEYSALPVKAEKAKVSMKHRAKISSKSKLPDKLKAEFYDSALLE
jgi:hypothetical protein